MNALQPPIGRNQGLVDCKDSEALVEDLSMPLDVKDLEDNVDKSSGKDQGEQTKRIHMEGSADGGENGCQNEQTVVVNNQWLDSATCGTKQPMVHGKLKRLQNPRDIAMWLGFYSNATEKVTRV